MSRNSTTALYHHGIGEGREEDPNDVPTKKLRRSVVIDETQNSEHHMISTSNGDRSSNSNHISKGNANVQHIVSALRKAYDTNSMQRAKVTIDMEDTDKSTSIQNRNIALLYMESEVVLYEHIVQLKDIPLVQGILYVLKNNVISDIFEPLLIHENADITISLISALLTWFVEFSKLIEITDDDDEDENNDDNENSETKTKEEYPRKRIIQIQQQFVHQLFEHGIPDLMVDNLGRMNNDTNNEISNINNDDNEDDVGRGIDDVLSIFEYMLDVDVIATSTDSTSSNNVGCRLMHSNTNLLSWLFTQQQDASDNDNDKKARNYRHQSMEMLATILNNEDIYNITTVSKLDWTKIQPYTSSFALNDKGNKNDENFIDAIEILLQNIGQYRKSQPSTDDEVEFLENNTIVMTSLLMYGNTTTSQQNNCGNIISPFIEAQGIELVIRCLKERVYAGALVLPWLEFNNIYHIKECRTACEHMVHVGILKYIFPIFMGKNLPKLYILSNTSSTMNDKRVKQEKKRKNQFYSKIEATTVRIMYTLVQMLKDDSPNDVKARFLAKFITQSDDNDDSSTSANERINRLIELIIKYDQQVRLAEYKFYKSDIEDEIQQNDHGSSDDNGVDSILQLAVLDTKLAAGGDILFRLVAIVAFCCVHSKILHRQVLQQLSKMKLGMTFIKDTLQEFIALLDDNSNQKLLLQSYLEKI